MSGYHIEELHAENQLIRGSEGARSAKSFPARLGLKKRRYVQVGVGSRGWSYIKALVQTHCDECELVGICDNNKGRLDFCNRYITKELKAKAVPIYPDTQFVQMIKEQKPDIVVVTSKDSTHDQYMIMAMKMGCDVIVEKPMTIDEKKCQRIINIAKRTDRNIKVTFNCRYMPPMMQVKELLMKGVIGRVISVDLRWMLDVDHGASYFRRWHAQKKNSGGLLLHKATHHFDLVNWFLSANPIEVFAMGARRFYGNKSGMAEHLGIEGHALRCLDCKHRKKCLFFFDAKKDKTDYGMYLACEKYDHYIRDRCVFGGHIDINDTMSLVVRYDSGAFLSYSLNAFLPWEGFHFAFNGTKGRLEFDHVGLSIGGGKKKIVSKPPNFSLRLYPHFKPAVDIRIADGHGSHWGGDEAMMKDLFMANPPKDSLNRAASYSSGAMSLLIGVMANKSMQTNKPARIGQFIRGLSRPKLCI